MVGLRLSPTVQRPNYSVGRTVRPMCTQIWSETSVHGYFRRRFPTDVHTNSVGEVRARTISDRHAHKFGRRSTCTKDFRPISDRLFGRTYLSDRISMKF